MAKYNREFLVPYLQSLCALHLAENKLNSEIADLRRKISGCKKGVSLQSTERPSYEKIATPGRVIALIWAGLNIWAGCTLLATSSSFLRFFAWLMFIAAGITLCYVISSMKESAARNDARDREYDARLQKNKKIQQANQSLLESVPEKERKLDKMTAERQKIRVHIAQLYGTNVIPLQYRDMYASVYLYRWFIGSREDDVGAALGMYVLEEIKSKLDEVIENQTGMILNQQIEISNQMKSLEAQREHNAQMREKLDRLQITAEEHSQYLDMIESNTKATAYFAATDYFHRIYR